MKTKELPIPVKIFPIEYAGFFDFNEEGIYGLSVINRDDYPNAEEIANEISKRYNNFDKMKEALEWAVDLVEESHKEFDTLTSSGVENLAKYKQLLESIK